MYPDGFTLRSGVTTVVDAGCSGWRNFEDFKQRDIRAVLLTHGHLDHTGLVTALQQAGADIWIHESDAAILADGPGLAGPDQTATAAGLPGVACVWAAAATVP